MSAIVPTRTGIANLPLHYGKAPPWLFERMVRLAREITVVIVAEFGAEEMLRRLSHPFWFQAFGGVLGFDWHSSGVTTTLCGALKEGIKGLEKELGLFVAGGKGKASRQTPSEIVEWGDSIELLSQAINRARLGIKEKNEALSRLHRLAEGKPESPSPANVEVLNG